LFFHSFTTIYRQLERDPAIISPLPDNLRKTPTVDKSFVQTRTYHLSQKSEAIDQVALAGHIGPDKDVALIQFQIDVP
jgi:hypothetical protein